MGQLSHQTSLEMKLQAFLIFLTIINLSWFIMAVMADGSKKFGYVIGNDNDKAGCVKYKMTFHQLEHELGFDATKRKQSYNPFLRVDLAIVADSKNVLMATYWPSTGYGTGSDYWRQNVTGHLEDEGTISNGNNVHSNNVLNLYNMKKPGKYTLELSDHLGVLATLCLTMTSSGEQNCRIKTYHDQIDESKNILDNSKYLYQVPPLPVPPKQTMKIRR